MKRSIIYLFFLATAFVSCENRDDTLFEETADARLNAALASYEKQLIEAPDGWNAVLYPGGGGSYGFYLKFDDKNRVVMYSDFSEESAGTSKESSYRLKAMQTPALIFDTYSYLHVLSDPNPDVNGGETGEGFKSDFEFSIFPDSFKSDVITLIGRKNQSKLVLRKATAAQATAYAKGDMAKGLLFNNISKYLTYFKRVTLGAVTYEIGIDQDSRQAKISWMDGTTPKSHSTKYYFSSTGLTFDLPLVNGSQTITGFSNITWNPNSVQLSVTAAGLTSPIVTAARPLVIDLDAPRRWWRDPIESGGDWRTRDAFHINGVDDALKVKTLTSGEGVYAFYVYQPGLNARYDLFGPVFFEAGQLSIIYGHAPNTPRFTNDGRVIFTEYGSLGAVPTTGPAVDAKNVLYEPSGYYLVQTSETTYDMVGAKDAKTWISWQ
jgi:hypothetical protein